MAGGGEIAAVFRSLAHDAAKAGEDIGHSIARFTEKTADIEEENVSRVLAADARSAEKLKGIQPNVGELESGGAGRTVTAGGGENPIAKALNGEETPGAAPDAAQLKLGEEMAADKNAEINQQVDDALGKVNPKFKAGESAYSENCTGCVQANELQRRGVDAQAGPLEKPLRTDEGGPGGRPVSAITGPWGGQFSAGSKADIEQAFSEPGSRGVVYIAWHGGGAHVFNVENVGGDVRFVDGQPTPPVTDASHYFNHGGNTHYIRLDNRPTPSAGATKPYLEP